MRFRLVKIAAAIVFCCAAAGLYAQQDDWYQGKPIKDIMFAGLRNVKSSELDGLMEQYIGKLFNDSIFWEIQGKLYALEYFDLITPSAVPADAGQNEVILRFAVTERPIVSRINFVGNSSLRRNELLDIVTIKVNDVVNQSKISADEMAIINKYLEKGFPEVKVRSETQAVGEASLHLNFYITEGEKIAIEELRFEGNNVFSTRTLRGQLSLKAKTLLNDGAFQEAKLIADRAAIAQYYHDRGYIDAEVIDVTREVSKDAKGNSNLILTFRVREGDIFTFGGITIEGNQIFSEEQLLAPVKSKTGEVVNARRLESDLQAVADLYLENGYIYNQISPQEIRDNAAGTVAFHIIIVERGRAHIENIVIKGNEKTQTEVILREIPLEPGDIFSRTKVMEAMRNLMNLQYFSMVFPETQPGSADNLMDLIFIVEEQPTTDLQFGLTFSGSADPDTFPISGLLKWNDRNFRGSGNQLGADLNVSPDTASMALNYNHRWIMGLPLSGGFDFTVQWSKRLAAMNNNAPFFNGDETYAFPDGFASLAEYVAASRTPPREFLMDYNQWYLSLGFSTGYRWSTPAGGLSVGGGVRAGLIRNNYDETIFRPFDPALRERNNHFTPKNSLWATVSLDKRDIYYDPSSGFYLYERLGLYGILGSPDAGSNVFTEREHYLRSDSKAEYYLTLFNIPVTDRWSFKTVLAMHSGLSLIFKQPGKELTVEEANKLAVDGMFIGRGWSGEYHVKGLLLWENWVEIRFPLVPGLLAWDLFFVDAAGVESTQGAYFGKGNFPIDNWRFSMGSGLRFTMPQFPFRFSLVKRFRTYDGEFKWEEKGPVFGLDPVISFSIAY